MSRVISFEGYVPTARYDGIAWTEVRIWEADALLGPYTLIDTVALTRIDGDPTDPQPQSFTTVNATDVDGLWYQLVFADDSGNTLAPLFPVQDVVARVYYATAEDLASILHVNVDDRRDELERVLTAAATEIDSELGLAEPYATPPALVAEVNLERAVEHWQQAQSPFGILGLGAESGPAFVGRDTWDRHAHKLAPLKLLWGLA